MGVGIISEGRVTGGGRQEKWNTYSTLNVSRFSQFTRTLFHTNYHTFNKYIQRIIQFISTISYT